jgi:hypothetical protein
MNRCELSRNFRCQSLPLTPYDISYPNLTPGNCDADFSITDPAAGAQNVRTSDENQVTLPDSGNIVQINLTEADG